MLAGFEIFCLGNRIRIKPAEKRICCMELVNETRWSRHYSMEELQTKLYESKFADGSANISLEELKSEWPTWSQSERMDFCQAVTQAKFAHLPELLRFVMAEGNIETWSAIANIAAKVLPPEVSVPFITNACLKAPVGKGAKFYQALALTRAPETIPTLHKSLDRIWADRQLMKDDTLFDWAAYDATCCLEYLLQLGDKSPKITEKYKILIQHPHNLSRQNAISRLGPFFQK